MSAFSNMSLSPSTTSLSAVQGFRRGGNPSLKKTIQNYKSLQHRLETKLEQLLTKREDLNSRAFIVLEESSSSQRETIPDDPQASKQDTHAVPAVEILAASQQDGERSSQGKTLQLKENSPENSNVKLLSPGGLVEQTETYHSDVTSLVSTATNILIESIKLRLSFIREALEKLNALHRENPKLRTPAELAFLRYEEWLASNQRLFELNAQLYDIERLKFELKHKQVMAKKVLKRTKKGEDKTLTGSMFLKSSVQRIQSFMARFNFELPTQNTTQSYIQELLNPRGDRTTLEAQKIQEFVGVCLQNMDTPTDIVVGAHPQSYQQFMTILCNYIVERQQEVQGEVLPNALVYTTVERHLMPKILPAVIRHVSVRERDHIVEKQCERFADVTLNQLKIREKLQSTEVVPFIEAITQMRASYFSTTPTDKMYAVVAAAKALYDRLAQMGESAIDGDTFLDLWVYVILKANVKDLGTNLQFMAEYGNPMLAMDEAGYYLTSLEAAVTFIESLEPEQLDMSRIPTEFVVCECSKFEYLSHLPSSCFELVSHRVELPGYKVTVIRDWAMNRARLFCTALLHTGDTSDVAIVSVIRFSLEWSSAKPTKYFTDVLSHPERSMEGLTSVSTPFGLAVMADTANINPQNLIILPTGEYDSHENQLKHVLQLIQLGSERRDDVNELTASSVRGSDAVDGEFVYVHTPPSSNLHPLLSGKQRSRQKSFTERIPGPGAMDVRRATSFTERVPGYSVSPTASPYLLSFEPNIDVSLNTLPSSPAKEQRFTKPQKSSTKHSWFGGRGKENKTSNISTSEPRGTPDRYLSAQFPGIDSPNNSPVHQGHPNVKTVEVEVYNSHPSPPSKTGLDDVVSKSQQDASGEHRNLLFSLESSVRGKESLDPRSKSSNAQTSSSPEQSEGFLDRLAKQGREEMVLSGVSQISSLLADDPFLATSQRFLSVGYVQTLEENFRKNHVVADVDEPVDKTMESIIRLGQLYLQRLNYLSVSYWIDGVYNDITVNAVLKFQEVHNTLESLHSIPLPENGRLTAATFQYLRQAFITIYASMLRLGLEKYLGANFDPISTDSRDIEMFKECVCKFQEESNLIGRCQTGVLCGNTIDKMRQIIRSHRYTM